MKTTKQAVIAIGMNGKERLAVSYGMTPDMDIRKKCYEIVKLIQDAKTVGRRIEGDANNRLFF